MELTTAETETTPLATEPVEPAAEATPEMTATTPAEATPEPSTEAPPPPEAATTTPEPASEPAAEPAPEPPVTPPSPSQPATIGRIVLYRLKHGPYVGQERPGIVVRVWNDNMVNLQVFTDGPNDGEPYQAGMYWATSVHEDDSEAVTPGTWRWPPRS